MLIPFISSYNTIYIFVKSFLFECLYFSEYDIRTLLKTYKLTTGSSNLKAQHKVLC